MAVYFPDRTVDEVSVIEASRRLEAKGAAVVGLNCSRGPKTILPLMKKVKEACQVSVLCITSSYCDVYIHFNSEHTYNIYNIILVG